MLKKILLFGAVIVFLGACRSSPKTATTDQKKSDDKSAPSNSTTGNSPTRPSGLPPNVSFVNTDATVTETYDYQGRKYVYSIARSLNNKELYDITIKVFAAGTDAGTNKTIYVSYASYQSTKEQLSVRLHYAVSSGYQWKPNPMAYAEGVFNLKDGSIIYEPRGESMIKAARNKKVTASIGAKKIDTKEAMVLMCKHLIANYPSLFLK
jgi:hypothetical protein